MNQDLVVYEAHLPAITGEANYLPGEPVDVSVLSQPTPPTQRKYLAISESKGFYYVDGSYVIEMLNKAYGPGRWWSEITSVDAQEADTGGEVEIVVSLRLFIPGGPVRGLSGLGSDKYRPGNKMDSKANTILSAETRALKRAARWVGIGLDVSDNEKEGAVLEAQQNTISALAKSLVEKGKTEAVVAIFMDKAPQAVTGDEVKPGLLTEFQLDPIKKALMAEMKAVSSAK